MKRGTAYGASDSLQSNGSFLKKGNHGATQVGELVLQNTGTKPVLRYRVPATEPPNPSPAVLSVGDSRHSITGIRNHIDHAATRSGSRHRRSIDHQRVYRLRNPGPSDPTEPSSYTPAQAVTVRPSTRRVFSGPVVELIGPITMSAAETFTQALMERTPSVVRIGRIRKAFSAYRTNQGRAFTWRHSSQYRNASLRG